MNGIKNVLIYVFCGLMVFLTPVCFAQDLFSSTSVVEQSVSHSEETRIDEQSSGMAIVIVQNGKVVGVQEFQEQNTQDQTAFTTSDQMIDVDVLAESM